MGEMGMGKRDVEAAPLDVRLAAPLHQHGPREVDAALRRALRRRQGRAGPRAPGAAAPRAAVRDPRPPSIPPPDHLLLSSFFGFYIRRRTFAGDLILSVGDVSSPRGIGSLEKSGQGQVTGLKSSKNEIGRAGLS